MRLRPVSFKFGIEQNSSACRYTEAAKYLRLTLLDLAKTKLVGQKRETLSNHQSAARTCATEKRNLSFIEPSFIQLTNESFGFHANWAIEGPTRVKSSLKFLLL